jgi:hypothetical protein
VLLGLVLLGVAIRLAVTFSTGGLPYDMQSLELVRAALDRAPLHLYSIVNPAGTFHWPYPPGYLPLVLLADGLANLFGGFSHLIRLPSTVSDSVIAWLVWRGLAGRISENGRLVAAALVALGPVFIAVTGYSAQIDSVAILPAVGALLVWERGDLPDRPAERVPLNRAVLAGILIGIAAAVKTVPLLMVLALAPSARSRRELALLAVCAVAVPIVSLLPFLFADPSGVEGLRHYAGAPGMGGLSLVLQPNLAQIWLTQLVPLSGITTWLFIHHAYLLNAAIVVAFGAYALRYRPQPRLAAALLWLLILTFGSGFFFQYLVWGLPFFLLAGYLRGTLALEAVVTAPMLIFYLGPWHSNAIVYVYVAIMLAVWAGWIVGAAAISRRAAAR